MDTLQASYRDDDDDDNGNDSSNNHNNNDCQNSDNISSDQALPTPTGGGDDDEEPSAATATPDTEAEPLTHVKDEPIASEDDEISDKNRENSLNFAPVSEDDDDEQEEDEEEPPPKKQKHLSSLTPTAEKSADEAVVSTPAQPTTKRMNATATTPPTTTTTATKKSKKKNSNSVWTKSTSRKGKKKSKNNNANQTEETVSITPILRFPDKTDDILDMKICLSKVYKAEKVELSDDRLSAGSTKGYRMVRATRGVVEGAWYFEIKVVKLGETGHTRLGWSTEKGDLQAPVGYDAESFGYRDIDGSKIHKALREKYGEEGYVEGDVIGFYINLPDGSLYAPKPPQLVWYKGQRYVRAQDGKEDPPKVVPGSEISFFKNGICQGVAFQDLYGGRYYPAASMYTLPNQPNCVVKFNFGPNFEFFPEDFGSRPTPVPMIEVPYHGYDGKVENGVSSEKKD